VVICIGLSGFSGHASSNPSFRSHTPQFGHKFLGATGTQHVRRGTHTPSKAPHHSNKDPFHHFYFLHNDFFPTHTLTHTCTRQHIHVRVLRFWCLLWQSGASPPVSTRSEQLQNAGLFALLFAWLYCRESASKLKPEKFRSS